MTMPHVFQSPQQDHLTPVVVESLRRQLLEALEFHTGRIDGPAVDDIDMAMVRRSEKAARDIQAALELMDDGVYGICQSCGAPIPVERLEAVPHSPACAACASSSHRSNAHGR